MLTSPWLKLIIPSEHKSRKNMPEWMEKVINEKKDIAKKLGCSPDKVVIHTYYRSY